MPDNLSILKLSISKFELTQTSWTIRIDLQVHLLLLGVLGDFMTLFLARPEKALIIILL
jgi:hypothetical protein